MSVIFKISDNYSEMVGYVWRNYDLAEQDADTIDARAWTWSAGPAAGGLYLKMGSIGLAEYVAAPIVRSPFKVESKGEVSRLNLSLGDIDYALAKLAANNVGLLRGARVIVRRTYVELDSATLESYRKLFSGVVTNFHFDASGVFALEVSERLFDWSGLVTRRLFSKLCGFKFKGERCAYAGVATFCDKTYDRCLELANTDNFGGFQEVASIAFRNVRIS